MIDIRQLSIRCGRCNAYQTVCDFHRQGELHIYTYECEAGECDADSTRTLVEVPLELDEFARRDPQWSRSAGDPS